MPDILTPIRVSELPEVTEVNDSDYLIIDNGNQTSRITSENFNENASESAHHYADEAARSALSAEQYAGAASGSAGTAAAKAQESNASAQDSEAWAVGKRAGTDVPSTDPTYHNNSKYFSEQAHTSATEASDSADTATEKAAEISAAAAQIEENTDDIALLMGDFASVESGMTATRAYAIGDLIIADGQLYRAIAKISNGATLTPNTNVVATSVDAEVKRIDAEKADKGGNYPDLTAGNANQLVSDSYVSDNAPYMMRPSAGGAEIGNREIDELVGGTVAWNQLAKDSKFISTSNEYYSVTPNSDGSITLQILQQSSNVYNILLTGNAGQHYATIPVNHKFVCPFNLPTGIVYRDSYNGLNYTQSGVYLKKANQNFMMSFCVQPTAAVGTYKIWYQIFDLTQMFGTTIADYVYALETATAGAGVQWFRRLFPNDYYAYDAGSLKSVEGVSAHVMSGKNLWNPNTYETFDLVGDGSAPRYGHSYQPGTYTIINNTNTTLYYRKPKADLSSRGTTVALNAWNSANVTVDAGYILWVFVNNAVSVSNAYAVMFGSDAEYEPYVSHTYPLDSSLTLRGMLKLDAANRLYYDGDRYASDGTVTRRYGVGTVSSANVALRTDSYTNVRYATFPVPSGGASNLTKGIVTAKYGVGVSADASAPFDSATHIGQVVVNAENGRFWVGFAKTVTLEEAQSALDGMSFIYELQTPTTEQADPFTNPQIVDNLGTEEYVTTGILPVGHETKYLADLKSKLEVAPDSPDADGDYIMRRTSEENVYAPLASAPAITGLGGRVTAVEGDVSTLDTDVTDLKSANPALIPLAFTLTQNIMIDGTDGAERASNASRYASNAVDVENLTKINLYSAFRGAYGAAFYDAHNAFISGVIAADGYNEQPHLYSLDVPAGAKYFRFTVYVVNMPYTDAYLGIPSTHNDLNDYIVALNSNNKSAYSLAFTLTNQKMIACTSGNEYAASASYYASNQVDVEGLTNISLYSAFSGDYGCAFYDADGVYISGAATADGYNQQPYTYDLAVPSTAKYFRFTVFSVNMSASGATLKVPTSQTDFVNSLKALKITKVSKDAPITDMPVYIKNNLATRDVGILSKGYILLSFDDGANTLATGTIPLLIENDVPGSFGLLPQSEIFAAGNESYLATVVDAIENHGCVVAMHGSAQWPTYAESALNAYFANTMALFAEKGLGGTYGAICPGGQGDDTSVLVKALAGGYFGYVFSGNRADKISYDSVAANGKFNGPRSNRFDLDRCSGVGITTAKAESIANYAAENHLLLCPFWHDNTLNNVNHPEYVTQFNALVTAAKSAGLTFITTADLPTIV